MPEAPEGEGRRARIRRPANRRFFLDLAEKENSRIFVSKDKSKISCTSRHKSQVRFLIWFCTVSGDYCNMDSDTRNKVEYLVVLINEFAKAHSLTARQAYRYLERCKAIDFIDRHYGVAHTQRFEDVIADLTVYCRRFGGAIV